MDLLALIKTRRSIRKYTDEQVSREDLEKVLEAGLYAANAGGAQRSMVVAVHDPVLTKRLGRMNMAGFNRAGLIGSYVSHEQPSVIDDPSIKDGFYGAPSVLCVFCQERFAFSVADAFCIAQTMTLEAHSLGLGSCIVSRAETTFLSPEGQKLLREWGVPEGYVCRAFVIVGHCDGAHPSAKPRREGRAVIVTSVGVQERR